MNPDNPEATTEQRFKGPLRVWEWIFLFILSASLFSAAIWQSHKEYLNHDELFTSILASNPSYSAMVSAIRRGGELNPPLYFSMEWAAARIGGTGDVTLRMVSMISVTLASWVLYFTLRSLTGPRLSLLAVALILGLSRDVFLFMSMARYYGFLFLLVSLGAYLVVRLSEDRPVTTREYVAIFLVNCALVWVHLYGSFYSGVLFVAMVVGDWLRGKFRLKLYLAWIAAWLTFLAWIPTTLQQIRSVTIGVYTPPNYYTLGFFIEELGLQIPLALIVLLITLLGIFTLTASRPCRAGEETQRIFSPNGWLILALVAIAIMTIPVGTWIISQVKQPPLYMRRYVFPCTVAWVLMVGFVLLAVYRLRPAISPFKRKISPIFSDLAWGCILLLCVGFQPLRAKKNPPLPPAAFTDYDYGHKDLPMVFEGSWGFVHRAVYNQSGRKYLLLIDHDAAEASTGWYTKCMERFFQAWYPRYQKAEIAHWQDLPDEFLAVDDDEAKTFEWIFPHHPEFKATLLGTREAEPAVLGQQRTYLVQKISPDKSK